MSSILFLFCFPSPSLSLFPPSSSPSYFSPSPLLLSLSFLLPLLLSLSLLLTWFLSFPSAVRLLERSSTGEVAKTNGIILNTKLSHYDAGSESDSNSSDNHPKPGHKSRKRLKGEHSGSSKSSKKKDDSRWSCPSSLFIQMNLYTCAFFKVFFFIIIFFFNEQSIFVCIVHIPRTLLVAQVMSCLILWVVMSKKEQWLGLIRTLKRHIQFFGEDWLTADGGEGAFRNSMSSK